MIGSFIKRISTITMVLILFSPGVYPLPMSRTCYTVPADVLDLYMGEELIADDKTSRIDVINIDLGLNYYTTLGCRWSYLNSDLAEESGESGDILVELWRYTGRCLNEKLDTGISFAVRIPSGPDPSEDEEWRNLSVGRNEIKIGPVFSFNLTEKEVLSFNLSYVLSEGEGDDFYGALRGDLQEPDTYKSFFGLNPFYGDSFFSGDRISDDYFTSALSIIEKRLYPAVFYGEMVYTSGNFREEREASSADSGGPLTLLSTGIKYFVRDSAFLHLNVNVNPFYSRGERKWGAGAGLNIFF